MPIDLPYNLNKGIFLEDSNILLDWNSSRDLVQKLANPQTESLPGNGIGFLWSNRRWLGGMDVTLYASLKRTEHLRRINVLPLPGKCVNGEFQRFSRHLALHLGAATRSSDKQGKSSLFWQRGDITLALNFDSRSDRIDFEVSYHGPDQFTADERKTSGQSFEHHLARLGLTLYQWIALKNYLLDLQAGIKTDPPFGLTDHPVTQLALQSLERRDPAYLDKAAAKLTGSSKQAWLILDKS